MKKFLLLASLAVVAFSQAPRSIRPWTNQLAQNVYFAGGAGEGRQLGQIYQNTSELPVMVTFSAFGVTSPEVSCGAFVGSAYPPQTGIATLTVLTDPPTMQSMSFVVEPGSYYQITCGDTVSILNWSESAL